MVHFKQHIVRLLPWLLLAALTGTVFSCVHNASVSGEPDDSFTPIASDAPAILYHGRIDHRDAQAPVFDWPASGFSVRFTGASIGAVLRDSGENDFSVFIDGAFFRRLTGETGEQRLLLADRLPPGAHTLEFYKSTEADQGTTTIKGLLLEPDAVLLPGAAPDFRIQVFGDSASSGYGAASGVPVEAWIREHADACRTWAFYAARALNADLTLTAASGRGLLRNYGERGPRSRVAFTELAWRVLLDDEEFLVRQNEPAPDVVIVCLGHNDMSPGYALNREQFREGYLAFLEEIHGRWPAVPVLCGSFRQERLSQWLEEIVDEKNAGGEKGFYWYEFTPLRPDEFGDDHHANARAHRRRAQEILPVIVRATGRKPMDGEER